MTTTVTIRFKEILQKSQELASESEHMTSTITFDVIKGSRVWPDQSVEIKQTVGSGFESDQGAIEVIGDAEHNGPKNYQGFRDCVEAYFRSVVGGSGSGVRVSAGATHVRMRNNRFVQPAECTYETA